MQVILADWLVDPSFGKTVVNNDVSLLATDMLRSKDQLLTYWQLVKEEGKEEADRLIKGRNHHILQRCPAHDGIIFAWRPGVAQGRRRRPGRGARAWHYPFIV